MFPCPHFVAVLNPVREAPKPLLRKQRRATAVCCSPPVFETELLSRLDRIECCCIAVGMLCATSPPPTLKSTNIAQETWSLFFDQWLPALGVLLFEKPGYSVSLRGLPPALSDCDGRFLQVLRFHCPSLAGYGCLLSVLAVGFIC